MRKHSFVVLMTVLATFGAMAQTDPVAVLQSDAPLFEKNEACRLLSTSGNVDAIPVLEPLLADESLSDMARYALEPMPGTEADAALRRALNTTSGKLKAGVVASLGVRRDVSAVSEIIPLLNDEDGYVKEAAARTLGRIGAPEGVNALEEAIARPDLAYAFAQALADGLFFAAEKLTADGNASGAARLYDTVREVEALPVHLRAGALRGAMLSRGPKGGTPLLLEALKGEDPDFFAVALRTAQEMKGKMKIATGIAELLPALPPERKVPVIQLLGELGRKKVGAAVLKEAESGPVPVRVAAINAAVRLAYVPVLPLASSLILSEDTDLAAAARNGLAYFPGEKGDLALRKLLKSDDAQVRRVAVELVGQGALPAPVDLLMQMAAEDADGAVRLAALKGAKDYVRLPQAQGLLGHLLQPRSPEEGVAAEEGLKLVCEREKNSGAAAVVITRAVYGDLPSGLQQEVTETMKQLVASGAGPVDANNANFGDTAPGTPKWLQVDYLVNDVPSSQTVPEGQAFHMPSAEAPAALVDPLCEALAASEGETRLALIRVLTVVGSAKAFDAVLPLASAEDAVLKEAAVRAVCDWPSWAALPALMEWVKAPADDTVRVLAFRGAVRLLLLGQDAPEGLCARYAELMALAASPDEKKLVLSGLSNVGHACALTLALDQVGDEAVKAETVLAVTAIAGRLGGSPEDLEALDRAGKLLPDLAVGKDK